MRQASTPMASWPLRSTSPVVVMSPDAHQPQHDPGPLAQGQRLVKEGEADEGAHQGRGGVEDGGIPAGSQRAATAYIRKGTPELMMPSTMMDLSLP